MKTFKDLQQLILDYNLNQLGQDLSEVIRLTLSNNLYEFNLFTITILKVNLNTLQQSKQMEANMYLDGDFTEVYNIFKEYYNL